jgi:hypothetical protein
VQLTRITTTRFTVKLGAAVLGAGLVATTYGAQAVAPATAAHHTHVVAHQRFVPPMVHKYLPDGRRMGLHCDSDVPTAG